MASAVAGTSIRTSATPVVRERIMPRCILCNFDTEVDDAVVSSRGRCICLRCYSRETDTQKPMTNALRREVAATLAAIRAE